MSTIKLTPLVDCWQTTFAVSHSRSDRGKLLNWAQAVNGKGDANLKEVVNLIWGLTIQWERGACSACFGVDYMTLAVKRM